MAGAMQMSDKHGLLSIFNIWFPERIQERERGRKELEPGDSNVTAGL